MLVRQHTSIPSWSHPIPWSTSTPASHAGDLQTSNQHPMLGISNAGFFSKVPFGVSVHLMTSLPCGSINTRIHYAHFISISSPLIYHQPPNINTHNVSQQSLISHESRILTRQNSGYLHNLTKVFASVGSSFTALKNMDNKAKKCTLWNFYGSRKPSQKFGGELTDLRQGISKYEGWGFRQQCKMNCVDSAMSYNTQTWEINKEMFFSLF